MHIVYHLGKANVIVDALRKLSMECTSHVQEGKRELDNDVHTLERQGVRLMDSKKGGIAVTNGVKSSLLSE